MISYTFVYFCDVPGCESQEIKELPWYPEGTQWSPKPHDFGWQTGLNGEQICPKHSLKLVIE